MDKNEWSFKVEEGVKNMEPSDATLRQLAKVLLAAMIEEGLLKAPNKKEVK